MKFTDAKFEKNADCIYDLVIGDDGDIEKIDSFWTAILLSIFCERRASPTEVPVIPRRRGWIGNINRPVEYGSKMWLLENARLINGTVNDARTYLEQCLSWLKDFNYLDQVTVTTSRDKQDVELAAGEIAAAQDGQNCAAIAVGRDLESSTMVAGIVLTIGGSEQLRRNVILWRNTRNMT